MAKRIQTTGMWSRRGSGQAIVFAALMFGLVGRAEAALHIVQAQSESFTPADINIAVGDTVRWTGLQSSPGHDVVQVSQACYNDVTPPICTTALAGGFISGDQGDVAQFEFTFNTVGTFYYICRPHHDDGMHGRVFVVAGPTATPSPTPSASPTRTPTTTPSASPTRTPTATPSTSPTPTSPPTPPPNDNCFDAICLTDGVPYNGDSTGANPGDVPNCAGDDFFDVWFTYTPAVSGTMQFDTCGVNFFDTTISIFDACDGNQLLCEDNDVCNSAQDQLTMQGVAGTTYIIRIAGVEGTTGPYRITATGGGGGCGNQAQVVSNTIPAQLAASHPASVSITMRNQGTTTWTPGAGYALALTLDGCAMAPGPNIPFPAGASVPPGGQHTFSFTLNPPAGLGTCNITFRMIQNGVEFGAALALSPEVVAVINNAQLMNEGVPDDLFVNQKTWVSLTVRNLGNAQWIPGGSYTLSTNTNGCTIVASANYPVFEVINPNTNATLFIYLVAPASPTTCAFQLQMKDSGIAFGPTMDFSVNIITKPNAAKDWSVYD